MGEKYIRIRMIIPDQYRVDYVDNEPEKWSTGDDGYCYYGNILNGAEPISTLKTQITKESMQNPLPKDDFNFVLIWEITDVKIGEDGNPYADWSGNIDEGGDEG